MRITEVSVKLATSPDGHLKAYASVELDEMFVVQGMRIIERSPGNLLVAFPNSKRWGPDPNGGRTFHDNDRDEYHYKDTCFPVTPEARDYFNRIVLGAYRYALRTGEQVTRLGVQGDIKKAV